jgi:hypothetical protein
VALLFLVPLLGRLSTCGTAWNPLPMRASRVPVNTTPVPEVEITWCFTGDGTFGRAKNVGAVPIEGLAVTLHDTRTVQDNGFVLGTDVRRVAACWQNQDGPEINAGVQISLDPGEERGFWIERAIPFLPPPDLLVAYGPDPEHLNFNIHVTQKRLGSDWRPNPVE